MKQNMKPILLQDLFIGAWVCEFLEIPRKEATPMSVNAIFNDGLIYLDFEENEGDPFEAEIKNIRGILIDSDTMRHFQFSETDHNVFEKKCDGYKVVVEIHEHQQYKLIRAKIQHDDGGFQFNDNLIYIHHLQKFAFESTRKPLVLDWK